jgi:uncharacterized protein with NAD-binding domain and iron-sulfur cluster
MAAPASPKKRIAVLGGGVGGLSAVFGLTEKPGWQDDYEITVYQLGWRLGGKCASGRDRANGERILEHGLHIWLGFYENAFRMMRKCYEECGRPAGAPLATWQEAFKQQDLVTVMEQIGGEWRPWTLDFPPNDDIPGDCGVLPQPWEYVLMMLRWLVEHHDQSTHPATSSQAPPPVHHRSALQAVENILSNVVMVGRVVERSVVAVARGAVRAVEETVTSITTEVRGTPTGRSRLHQALHLAESLDSNAANHAAGHHFGLLWLLEQFVKDFAESAGDEIHKDDELRRLWILSRLGIAIATGMIRDGVIHHGFDVIDGYDLTEWLKRHGATEPEIYWSAVVRGIYELVFAYDKGSTKHPNLGAGTGLRGALRMFFTYKGSIFWKMQAGMADTIFTPMYEVLTRRGVRFELFHRIDKLGTAKNSSAIDTVEMGVQATIKKEAGEYRPFRNVKGLDCWPSDPLYEQLVEGEALRAGQINLESAWTPWKDVGKKTLRRGEDFDILILGIPVGALSFICADLAAARQDWRDMLDKVQTVQTLALQLWFDHDIVQMGWSQSQRALVSSYVEPLDTWADMSQLIDREAWPPDCKVANIAYFCGPLEDAETIPAPFADPGFPERQADRVYRYAQDFLEHSVRPLWPGATTAENRDGLNWTWLVDGSGGHGAERLRSQYWRANIDPWERYVLSVKSSVGYRLRPDQSGFENLYLAGDWTYSGINAGCVEAAVVSGLKVSRAIGGYPETIVGETDI